MILPLTLAFCSIFALLLLSKPRRQWKRERGKTKDLMGRTIAQHVRFKTLWNPQNLRALRSETPAEIYLSFHLARNPIHMRFVEV